MPRARRCRRCCLKLLFTLMPKRAPALLRPIVRKVSTQALTTLVNPQLKQHMAFWEEELGKSEWFAGNDFTAADIQMSFPLEAGAARGGLEQGHPKSMAFLERIHARPAYKRALEKGGPYEIGGVSCHSGAMRQHRTRDLEVPGSLVSTRAPERQLSIRRRDHVLDQPRQPAHIAGGIDAVAHPHHHHVLRGNDHAALAEIA